MTLNNYTEEAREFLDFDLDLDSEWNVGRIRKQEKYLINK